ncbi:MAG: hypothetical protein COA45_01690 [Zetaproteobacteria bacterium]|nr:MAG: hypothetical protein COA45_01690 [Zetaproteobacteria bacterium]
MFKIPKDKFIIICAFIFAFNQGVNAGVNSYYGYYPPEHFSMAYAIIMFVLIISYVRAIGYEFPCSFDKAFFLYMFYIFLMPYIFIKKKGWVKGFALIILWYILITISPWVSLAVDLLCEIPMYKEGE